MANKKSVYQIMSLGLITLITSLISILVSIGVMIKGWGVDPQSYGWIWGGGIFTAVLSWLCSSVLTTIFGDSG
jgi:membrane-anchored glycerophosphoryl diester phosphodiesterase (GDPDase)